MSFGEATAENGKVVVLGGPVESRGMYEWLLKSKLNWECVQAQPDWMPDAQTSLLVTHRHYSAEEVGTLQRVYAARRVPILILMDGVLEFRNTWRHPELPIGTFLQPAIGDKVACIGPSQARWLASWGNASKCEVVGLPRLDPWAADYRSNSTPLGISPEVLRGARPLRLLIASARRVGFTPAQVAATIDIYREIYSHCQDSASPTFPIEVRWRVGEEIAEGISLSNQHHEQSGDLGEMIRWSDVTLTTPSTLMIEAMLAGKLVVSIDPHDEPIYLPTAWTLNRGSDWSTLLAKLRTPDPARYQFQTAILNDSYQWREPAAERMLRWVQRLMQWGEIHRDAGPLPFECSVVLEESIDESPASERTPGANRRVERSTSIADIEQQRVAWNQTGLDYPQIAVHASPAEALAMAAYRQLKQEIAELQESLKVSEALRRQSEHAERQVERLTTRVHESTERSEQLAARNRGLHARLIEANERIDTLRQRLGLPPISRPHSDQTQAPEHE